MRHAQSETWLTCCRSQWLMCTITGWTYRNSGKKEVILPGSFTSKSPQTVTAEIDLFTFLVAGFLRQGLMQTRLALNSWSFCLHLPSGPVPCLGSWDILSVLRIEKRKITDERIQPFGNCTDFPWPSSQTIHLLSWNPEGHKSKLHHSCQNWIASHAVFFKGYLGEHLAIPTIWLWPSSSMFKVSSNGVKVNLLSKHSFLFIFLTWPGKMICFWRLWRGKWVPLDNAQYPSPSGSMFLLRLQNGLALEGSKYACCRV